MDRALENLAQLRAPGNRAVMKVSVQRLPGTEKVLVSMLYAGTLQKPPEEQGTGLQKAEDRIKAFGGLLRRESRAGTGYSFRLDLELLQG